jgi:hypothetical protein
MVRLLRVTSLVPVTITPAEFVAPDNIKPVI